MANVYSGRYHGGSIINFLRDQRRCSYCRRTGHHLSCCNDTTLLNYETVLMNKKEEILTSGFDRPINVFKSWLLEESGGTTVMDTEEPGYDFTLVNFNLVKSFAVRKCGATNRTNVERCINLISNYVWQLIDTEEFAMSNNIIIHNIINEYKYNSNSNPIPIEITLEEHLEEHLEEYGETNDSIEECGICYQDKEKSHFVKLNECVHQFCGDCTVEVLKRSSTTATTPKCAFCRSEIKSLCVSNKEIFEKVSKHAK